MMDEDDRNGTNGRELKPMVSPRVVQAFVAGLIVGNLNKALLLGFTIGAVGGAFIQQNFPGVPDIVNTWKDLKKRWNRSNRGGSDSPNR